MADTRRAGVEYPVFTESYQPYTQDPRSMTILLRTAGEPTAMAPLLRAVVRELDKRLVIEIRTPHYFPLTINREMCSSTFLDAHGRPAFQALQHRGVNRSAVVYYAFDLLHLGTLTTRRNA